MSIGNRDYHLDWKRHVLDTWKDTKIITEKCGGKLIPRPDQGTLHAIFPTTDLKKRAKDAMLTRGSHWAISSRYTARRPCNIWRVEHQKETSMIIHSGKKRPGREVITGEPVGDVVRMLSKIQSRYTKIDTKYFNYDHSNRSFGVHPE